MQGGGELAAPAGQLNDERAADDAGTENGQQRPPPQRGSADAALSSQRDVAYRSVNAGRPIVRRQRDRDGFQQLARRVPLVKQAVSDHVARHQA
jgi:hypothetical protein